MKVNKDVTHELFTEVQVDEVIVEIGDSVADVYEQFGGMYTHGKLIEVYLDPDTGNVGLLFTRMELA